MERIRGIFLAAVALVLVVVAYPPIGIAWTMAGLMIYGLFIFLFGISVSPIVILVGLAVITLLFVWSFLLIGIRLLLSKFRGINTV